MPWDKQRSNETEKYYSNGNSPCPFKAKFVVGFYVLTTPLEFIESEVRTGEGPEEPSGST